jgi:hypothetical protein
MFQRALLLLSVLFTGLYALAQDSTAYVGDPPKERKDTRPLKDRLWFGGGLGLQFGTYTSIQASPMVGYKVDQDGKFSVGTGITYQYTSDKRYTPAYSYSLYGYRLFTRYRVIEQAYIHAEFLHMNAPYYVATLDSKARLWVPHLLLGGGVRQPIGGVSTLNLQILWEVLQDPNSVYRGTPGPIISGGVGFGF